MKSIGLVLSYLAGSSRRRNLKLVGVLVGILVALVAVFSVVFHVLMEREGRDHSWATGIYWTMTVMSTLGFGDITFESDAGRIFTVIVLVSGAMFILVLLPFVFIQFVFMPWVAWLDANRAPRRLPETTRGHVVVLGTGAVSEALIHRAEAAGVPYVAIEPDHVAALARYDEGTRVMVGELDSPETYRLARVDQAALVASTLGDTTNANIAFTVREIAGDVPVVATAKAGESVDILTRAGCSEVIELGKLLGEAMARRVLGRDGRCRVIGTLDRLCIAEATVVHDDLTDNPLKEAQVRERANVHVVGTWEHGTYLPAGPDTVLRTGNVVILAGTREHLDRYDEAFGHAQVDQGSVLVVGAGRIGRAAAAQFQAAGIPYCLVEKDASRVPQDADAVIGDAADLDVLDAAGIDGVSAVLVTTHDDDVNVYLSIYISKLRPDVQLIARATLDRNVATLHRAGADAVLSYASFGASAMWNALGVDETLVLAEGLEVFRAPVPSKLVGLTLADSHIRSDTGSTVVALVDGDRFEVNPAVNEVMPAGAEIVIIADPVSRGRFTERYRADGRVRQRRRGPEPQPGPLPPRG